MLKARFLILATIAFSSFSCSDKADEYDRKKAISAFVVDDLSADSSLEKTPIIPPKQQANNSWSSSNSEQNSLVENIAKSFSEKSANPTLKKTAQIWSGYRPGFSDRFVFSPAIKDGKIFLLDASGILSSYDLAGKKKIWESRVFPRLLLKNYQMPKIYLAEDKIFAIAGSNKIAAAARDDGKILWSKDISSIPVSAPVSDGNLVYISTSDNKLYALNANSGELEWVQQGISRPTAIFGSANPVIYQNLVIVSYSSGEIYAVNKKTGEPLWSQDLNLNKAVNSNFYLNDIDATPLVKDDVVYAIGNGGLLMAINVKNGNYLWKKSLAGTTDFWLAGDFLFLISNDNKLLSIHKKTGGIKWFAQLPNFKKNKKPETKIVYSGLIMAGEKLLISSAEGELLIISPFDGKIEKTFKTHKKLYHSPTVIGDKIYLHALGKFSVDLIELE